MTTSCFGLAAMVALAAMAEMTYAKPYENASTCTVFMITTHAWSGFTRHTRVVAVQSSQAAILQGTVSRLEDAMIVNSIQTESL